MANSQSLPLCEKTPLKINTLQRAQEIAILFLFICLLVYRLLSLTDHGFVWLLAFLCESWFTFNWVLTLIIQWTPVEYKTYPQNLLQQVPELPAVDMFVTTADAELEPPIITVNTVLSLLAVDYPSHKLACYVSDDGCSPLTLYSLTEASKFAKFWVPFCKKYNIQVRAPFRYFSGNSKLPSDNPIGFLQEWTKMKDEYQKLCQKIEVAVQNLATLDFSGDYVDFADIDRRNHPTIIKGVKDLAKMTLFMNESYADRRLPHHRNPKEFVPLDHLADLWVMENLGQSFRARSLNLIARMHHSLLSVPTLNAPLLMRHYFSAPSFLVSNFPAMLTGHGG